MKLNPEYLTGHYNETGTLAPAMVKAFQEAVFARYRANPRPMQWRETRDPYRILISEIMLQQTQVERVKAKYAEFLVVFPTFSDLAGAPLPHVVRVWQGLGYNRRALALKRCAGEIMERFAGQFPATIEELESLPGIGPYTARAVAAFAFGTARRLSRLISARFSSISFSTTGTRWGPEMMPLVAATLDRADPAHGTMR